MIYDGQSYDDVEGGGQDILRSAIRLYLQGKSVDMVSIQLTTLILDTKLKLARLSETIEGLTIDDIAKD